jgi:hypothetical protein
MINQVINDSAPAISTYEKFTHYLKEKVVKVAQRIFAFISEKYNICKSFCKEKFAAFKASFFTSANTNPTPRQRSLSNDGVELMPYANSDAPLVAADQDADEPVDEFIKAIQDGFNLEQRQHGAITIQKYLRSNLARMDQDADEPVDEFIKAIQDGFVSEQNLDQRKNAAITIQKFVKPKLQNKVVQEAVESKAKPPVKPQRSNSPIGVAAITLAGAAVGMLCLKQNPEALSQITKDTKVLAELTSDAASHLLGKAAEGVSFGCHHLGKAAEYGANLVKAAVKESFPNLEIHKNGFSYNLAR